MADVHSKETKSYNMSKIRGKDTKPEILVRKFLFSKGFRYKLHDKKLPGTPDIVFPKYKTVIFINGCFWHGHKDCKFYVTPKTRVEWWLDKINRNIEKDIENEAKLVNIGWNIIVVWECELKPSVREINLRCIIEKLKKC